MNRRIVLIGAATSPLALGCASESAPIRPLAEIQRGFAAYRAAALKALPYERIELGSWDEFQRLRSSGRGWPIVVGNDEDLGRVAEGYVGHDERSPTEILHAAGELKHPRDLLALRVSERGEAAEGEDVAERLRRSGIHLDLPPGMRLELDAEPDVGEWPTEPPWSPGLQVAFDRTGELHPRLQVLLIPTDEGASVPAYLRWGGWNSCPPPEHHVAALRSWRERYGAELIGLSADVMNLRVTRRPASRGEALGLAREHHDYCPDNIREAPGSLAAYAAQLMASDWWYFWWD